MSVGAVWPATRALLVEWAHKPFEVASRSEHIAWAHVVIPIILINNNRGILFATMAAATPPRVADADELIEEILAKKGPHRYSQGLSEANWEEVSHIQASSL